MIVIVIFLMQCAFTENGIRDKAAFKIDTIFGIFVSPIGSDLFAGTYSTPFQTITKAMSVAQPGDTIFIRGGQYILETKISISKNG